MIRLGTVVLGAEDVDRAVAFWSEILGYDKHQFPDSANQFTILIPPSREGTRVAVQRSETPAQERPRVHLDLIVDTGAEQEAEVARVVSLGGSVADWAYPNDGDPNDDDFVVVADTEGNRFCIVNVNHSNELGKIQDPS